MTKKLIIKISAIILTIVLAVVGIIVVFLSLNRNNSAVQDEQVNNGIEYTEENLSMLVNEKSWIL